MDYRLALEGETFEITAKAVDENRLAVTMGDDSYEVTYTRISDHYIHMEIDGKGVNVFVADTVEGKEIHLNGGIYSISDVDAGTVDRAKRTGAAVLPDTVTPPMPAMVIDINVANGDTVEKGQGVLVVSAMKMETTLVAPYAGTVTGIHTAIGEKVMPGDVLMDIEKKH